MPDFDLTHGVGFGFKPSKQRNRANPIDNSDNIDLDADYVLIYKDIDNIIDDINFDNEDDKLITRDIVDSLEHDAAKFIKEGLCVRIPFICTIRRNPIEALYKAHYKDLKEKRKTMSKSEYKTYAKNLYRECKLADVKKQEHKKNINKLRRKVQTKYNNIVNNHGRVYANLWLYAISNWQYVPFDWDIEEAYQNAWKDE